MQDKTILYNPLAERGILVAGKGVARILELCDGSQNISSIAKKISLSYKDTFKIVEKMANYAVLDLPGYQPHFSPPKKELRLRVWVNTTNACNLACHYCYVRKDGNKMSITTAHKLVDAFHKSISVHRDIKFTLLYVLGGGEPFINFNVVKEILDYSQVQAQKLGLKRIISIATNGTILNSEIIALVKHNNISLGISLDGLENMNRNRLFRNGRSSVNVVLRNIDKLLNAGVHPFILITVTQENLDGLIAFTKYLLERELGFSFTLARDLNTVISLNKYTDRLIAVLSECYNLMEKILPRCSRYIEHRFETVAVGYHSSRGCSLGRYSFAVSYDGKAYPCQMDIGHRPPVATIKDNDILGKLWTYVVYPELNGYTSQASSYTGSFFCILSIIPCIFSKILLDIFHLLNFKTSNE